MCKEEKTIIKAKPGMMIKEVKIINEGDAIEYYSVPDVRFYANNKIEDYLKLIEVSSLSKRDKVFRYSPKTVDEKLVKKNIFKAIDMKLKDFMIFRIDPSIDYNRNIIYKEGMEPVVGMSVEWWYKRISNILPERNSRLGDIKQYYAYLGYLINYLVKVIGYDVDRAWDEVCNKSKNLGHYYDSDIDCLKDPYLGKMRPTGSNKIGEFADLANTVKIVKNNSSETGFSIVGGCYNDMSNWAPLSFVRNINSIKLGIEDATAWVVCDVNKK